MFIKTQHGLIINANMAYGFYIRKDDREGKYRIIVDRPKDSNMYAVVAEYDNEKEAWDNLGNFYDMLSYQIPSYSFEKEDSLKPAKELEKDN